MSRKFVQRCRSTAGIMTEAVHITRSLLPILILNWMLGMGVIEYPLGKPNPAISLIYSLTTMAVYYAISALSYQYLFSTKFIYSHTKLPTVLLFYSNLFLTLSMKKLSWHCWKGMPNFATKLSTIDNLLQRLGIRLDYQKIANQKIAKTMLSCFIVIIAFCVNAYLIMSFDTSIYIRILISVIFSYPMCLVNTSDFTFMACINFATYRFRKLNRFLESLLTCSDEMPCHVQIARLISRNNQRIYINHIHNIEKDFPDYMRLAKRIHLLLIKLCQEIDRIYALSILQSISVAFILLTGNTYLAYTSLFVTKSTENLANELAYTILWTSLHLTKLFLLSLYTHKCEQQSILTGDLINKMYDEPWISREAQGEILEFNMQMIQRPLEFSAGGFITLDLSLVQIMIHTITTYLVIIVQLGQIHNKNSCDKMTFTNIPNMTAVAH